ncbi:MAG: TetR/AcrR family transcriptional regulator [Rickettsiales bacterium]
MGRKLTFCKEEALENTMRLFWRKGYEATSVRDIAAVLGVPIASVYHSFGDKKSIFIATIDEYFEKFVKPNFEVLLAQDNAKQALLDLFASLAEQCGNTDIPAGCYLVQTASEISDGDSELAGNARGKLEYIRLQLKTLIEKARRSKQLTTKETSDNLANYLFATMLAVKTWSRTGVDTDSVKQYLRLALRPITA